MTLTIHCPNALPVPNHDAPEPSPAAAEATDEALMQEIIARRPEALNRLHARYRSLLGKIALEILPNAADAEEALQDVFIEVWNRAANYDVRKGKPLGWIICMTRRRAIDHYRKIRRRADAGERLRLETEETGAETESGGKDAGTESVTLSDLRRFLAKILGTLPVEQERVVELSYFREMSQREIATHTGIPLGTIKTRLDLALRKLAQKSAQFREELYYAH